MVHKPASILNKKKQPSKMFMKGLLYCTTSLSQLKRSLFQLKVQLTQSFAGRNELGRSHCKTRTMLGMEGLGVMPATLGD